MTEPRQSLLFELASKEVLNDAWLLLNKDNQDSKGWSGTTIKDFSQNLESNIDSLSGLLKANRFHFSATRAAIIKKDNGNYRPLQIPEIKDRVVLKAMSILLERELRHVLSQSEGISFAYQQGKGVREAVLKMKSSYLQEGKVILKADIINFFEEVKKEKLLNDILYPNLRDDSMNKLIIESMSQKLEGLKRIKGQKHLFKNVGLGIPQGNPLSPLLSNIYLSSFDLYCKEKNYSLIRYADDFIVICNSEEEANKGYEDISNFLDEQFSLKIHALNLKNGKTEIINPQEKEFSFLSIKFDGQNIYPGKETIGVLKQRIRRIVKKGELNRALFNDIYEVMEKWIALYSYTDIERYFEKIDSFLINELSNKFQRKDYNYITSKCKYLAQKVRNKQHNKSTKSFWRKVDLISVLPKFVRDITRQARMSMTSS